jgi:GNAT superfamily N-acetyltransferase
MIDIDECGKMAEESGALRDIELSILKEALSAWQARPGNPYTVMEVRDGRVLAGFAVFAKAANSDFTFDVLGLFVDGGYRDKAVGKKLIDLVEEEALRLAASAIVRFETSIRKIEAMGKGLLVENGYALIGHIADFYEKGDDYFIYARHLLRPRPERKGTQGLPQAGASQPPRLPGDQAGAMATGEIQDQQGSGKSGEETSR